MPAATGSGINRGVDALYGVADYLMLAPLVVVAVAGGVAAYFAVRHGTRPHPTGVRSHRLPD